MDIYGLVLMCTCFSLTKNVFEEITCGNGGSYVRNIVVKCQDSRLCDRINCQFCMCPDGFNGSRCDHVLYWSFDTLDNLTTMERSEQVNFDPRVPDRTGQINSAVSLNSSRGQWIDLGVHHVACMVDPETCGAAGGAVSIWMRVFPIYLGVFLSTNHFSTSYGSTGITIYTNDMKTAYRVLVQDGRFVTHVPVSNHWVHSVINYIGPNAGEGFRLYLDGINVKNETRKRSSTSISNNGTIVTGRLFTDFDEFYASFQMDELLFYNRTLTEPEIIMLSQNTA